MRPTFLFAVSKYDEYNNNMSAGICLLNRYGVVLAADSAVTIGDHATVFNSANKIHKLSDSCPVGVIIYSNACFEYIPFEIIICDYRKCNANKKFDDLNDFVIDFLRFIELKGEEYNHNDNERFYLDRIIADVFNVIKNKERKILSTKDKLEESDFDIISNEIINEINSFHIKDGFALSDSILKYKDTIIQNYSTNPEFNKIGLNRIADIVTKSCELMKTDYEASGYVDLAVCGFGEKNIFPKCQHLLILGITNGKINYKIKDNISISTSHLDSILPLAQSDVMTTFLLNANVNTLDNLKIIIQNVASNQIASFLSKDSKERQGDLFGKMSDEVVEQYIEHLRNKEYAPIHNAMSTLPIKEMTQFAESMINITSIKRMVVYDNNVSTVGGAIDIASITRKNGFVWVKSKN